MNLGHVGKAVQWVGDKWSGTPVWVRVVFVAGLLGGGVLAVYEAGWVSRWLARYDDLPAAKQSFVLAVAVVVAVLLLGALMYTGMKREKADLTAEIGTLRADLAKARDEARLANERWDLLQKVETQSALWWNRPTVVPPEFVSPAQRGTRFVTVLNLKGGVGKTTLVANVAACLGQGDAARRVLLVDIDFQGTLSEAAADPLFRRDREEQRLLVHQLLVRPDPDDDALRRFLVPLAGVPTCRLVMANDRLDTDDFQQQAKFFVDPTADPRFRFRAHLHRPAVFDQFDVVIFDCPPRVTTSVVNALFCTDYLLIPTRLDAGSIDAVPRLLRWVQKFGPLCPATRLGVVAGHVAQRGGTMTAAEHKNYLRLREEAAIEYKQVEVWEAFVPTSPDAVSLGGGRIASQKPAGRKLFEKVVEEFRRRVLS